ncbi:unnamed protein product [Rhizopus stolonifer]
MISQADYNPFRRLNKKTLLTVFSYIIPHLSRQDIITCNLINSSFYQLTCDTIWSQPRFDETYIHNELYMFNRFLSSLPSLSSSTLAKIKTLDLSSIQETLYERVNPDFFRLLVKHCPHLCSLNLSHGSYFSKQSLPTSWSLPQLTLINLSDCSHVTDDLLVTMARSCRQLSTVLLDQLPQLQGHGLAALAAECDLDRVQVAHNRSMKDEGLVALAKFRHIHLRHLDLTGCTSLTPLGLKCLARFCIHLQKFSMAGCRLDESLPLVCKRMVSLDLSRGPKIKWGTLSCLESLSIDFQELLNHPLEMPKLCRLTLTSCPDKIPVLILDRIPKQLEHLVIERNGFLDQEDDDAKEIFKNRGIYLEIKRELSEW